ncbi:MAG: hypothetical protein OXF79_17450 [Chloroflexi bacterium]|nr:hypothetical protein [Chloroflexota bacterium]
MVDHDVGETNPFKDKHIIFNRNREQGCQRPSVRHKIADIVLGLPL